MIVQNLVLTLARKPITGTVAQNVLVYETGGLAIDACRISGPAWKWGTQTDIRGGGFNSKRPSEGDVFAQNVESNPKGRWPANLILEHLTQGVAGCQCTGTKSIKSKNAVEQNRDGQVHNRILGSRKSPAEVSNWICQDGCPVAALDFQSGVSRSALRQGGSGEHLDPSCESWRFKRAEGGFEDVGGASRFFKQVGSP